MYIYIYDPFWFKQFGIVELPSASLPYLREFVGNGSSRPFRHPRQWLLQCPAQSATCLAT